MVKTINVIEQPSIFVDRVSRHVLAQMRIYRLYHLFHRIPFHLSLIYNHSTIYQSIFTISAFQHLPFYFYTVFLFRYHSIVSPYFDSNARHFTIYRLKIPPLLRFYRLPIHRTLTRHLPYSHFNIYSFYRFTISPFQYVPLYRFIPVSIRTIFVVSSYFHSNVRPFYHLPVFTIPRDRTRYRRRAP